MTSSFDNKKVFLIGGSGGVGKTTVAASLAIKLAKQGHRTVVLTVDPARRLAQALGIDSFSSELQKISIPDAPEAKLFSTMLDAQRDFDRIVERFSPSPEKRDKILNSRLYRIMVRDLAGTHEYAAMERLLEFASNPEFDRIVIDTPPSQNAVDLFTAPERVRALMDSSVMKWLQNDTSKVFSIFKQGTRLAMKALDLVLGNAFINELSALFREIEGMQEGFIARNKQVMETLRSDSTAFLLVTYPSEIRFEETSRFLETLKRFEVPIQGLILNRLEPFAQKSIPHSVPVSDEVRSAVDPVLSYFHELFEEQQIWIKKFEALFSGLPTYKITKLTTPLHDVEALSQLKGLDL